MTPARATDLWGLTRLPDGSHRDDGLQVVVRGYAVVTAFLEAIYQAGAELAGWNRPALERVAETVASTGRLSA